MLNVEQWFSPDTVNVLQKMGYNVEFGLHDGGGRFSLLERCGVHCHRPEDGRAAGRQRLQDAMEKQWATRKRNYRPQFLIKDPGMVKAVSTYLYVKERLHPGILDGLARSGVQAIEIFAARQHLDYANRKAHVKEIAEWFRGSGVPLNSVHSPLYADYEWGRAGAPPVNMASTDRAGLVEAMDEVKRALEIAEQIPFRFLVQHLGVPNESFSEKKFESAMTCDRALASVCQAAGRAHSAGKYSERAFHAGSSWWR